MTNGAPLMPPKCQRRVQAVLALFRGEAVAQVSTQYRISNGQNIQSGFSLVAVNLGQLQQEAL